MLSLFNIDNDKNLQKIFENEKSKPYILSCYNIISNSENKNIKNPKDIRYIEDNQCIFSCQVELLDLINYDTDLIKLDCKVVILYEGIFGCRELFEGNKVSLIVDKNKLCDKENFIFDKLIFDKIFSFYADSNSNDYNIYNDYVEIQNIWKELKFPNKNCCYIQLYCLVDLDIDNNLEDLILF